MLSLVASATTLEEEDRFTDMLKLLSLSQEWINCLSLCNLGKPEKYLCMAGQAIDLE